MERRQFYRIEHPAIIDFQRVSERQIRHSTQPDLFQVSPFFLLLTKLKELDAEAAHCLYHLGEHSPMVESCYRALNRKIDLIARTLAAESFQPEQNSSQFISLSEGGIQFTSSDALDADEALAIKLVFPDSLLGLLLYARVTRCHSLTDTQGHAVGAEFLPMPENCRTQLARLILEAQAKQRQHSLDRYT